MSLDNVLSPKQRVMSPEQETEFTKYYNECSYAGKQYIILEMRDAWYRGYKPRELQEVCNEIPEFDFDKY